MKKILKAIALLAGVILILSACDDYTKLNAPALDSGNANFSKYVAIGNSLTAGYQSSSLFESAQNYSYGKLIANAMRTGYEQPLVSDPGTGGRLEVQSLSPFSLYTNPNVGVPKNINYAAPYNNLGVPGAFLYDVLNATNSSTCFTAVFAGVPNPMFDLILRNLGTQFQQAAALDPTIITLWIGNNDVLGFATSGGTSPSSPTDVNLFTALYGATGNAISSLGADVVVANIPDVSTIPFFTTVGPQMALGIPWGVLAAGGAPGLFYQAHGNSSLSMVFTDSLSLLYGSALPTGVLVTLKGSSYASLVGSPGGKFYRDFGYPGIPAGIDTTKPFGVHPQNPWPDALILDPSEITTAVNTVDGYNAVIQSVANANGFGLVNVNGYFKSIRANDFTGGTMINGIAFTTMFVTGGLFSLDGVHPTSQGQAVIANQFIEVINSEFGANIAKIDVSAIPGSLNFAGKISYDAKGYAIFSKDAFDHLLF